MSAPEARPPFKVAAQVKVDRRVAELDHQAALALGASGGYASIVQRLVERQRRANDAVVARQLVNALAEGAHRGVLVIQEDDGTVTASVDGRVPGRTVAQLRRQDVDAWESRGCPT